VVNAPFVVTILSPGLARRWLTARRFTEMDAERGKVCGAGSRQFASQLASRFQPRDQIGPPHMAENRRFLGFVQPGWFDVPLEHGLSL